MVCAPDHAPWGLNTTLIKFYNACLLPKAVGLFQEIKFELSWVVFAVGLLMTIMVLFHSIPDLTPHTPDFIQTLIDGVGNYILYMYVAGPLLGLGGGWYFVDLIRKRREFDRLVSTGSKAMFVRNQDRMEKLLWHLPKIYEKRYLDRRREFRIRE
jgi:hypothetical protein